MKKRYKYPLYNVAKLSDISATHSLRCDAKQFEDRFKEIRQLSNREGVFYLGELLPEPLIKGSQPTYIDGTDGIPVINTLSIQKLKINTEDCRYITEEDFENLPDIRKLKKGDVLLTMDGGTSIGKSVLFDLDGDYTVDSHVAILRPVGISPKALVYLLASPAGQLQFNKAESGASGQTAVTEEDLRRFLFKKSLLKKIEELSDELDSKRIDICEKKEKLDKEEQDAWNKFSKACLKG